MKKRFSRGGAYPAMSSAMKRSCDKGTEIEMAKLQANYFCQRYFSNMMGMEAKLKWTELEERKSKATEHNIVCKALHVKRREGSRQRVI